MNAEPFTPDDFDIAHAHWGATCGPAAFAAVVRRPVMAVRPFFPGFPRKAWVTPTAMKAALDAAAVRWKDTAANYHTRTPLYGLAFVQLAGPWTRPGVNAKWAYKFTHWVGVAGGRRYDANVGAWVPEAEWRTGVMAELVAAHDGATGFYDRSGIEILGLPREGRP